MNRAQRWRRLSVAAALLGMIGWSGQAAQAQFGAQPRFIRAVATAPKAVEPGKPFTLKVAVTIDKPYHIQSNPPKQDYVPTELEVGAVKGFKAGKVTYPKAMEAKIGDETLPVYEGTVEIKVEVTPEKSLKPGKFILPITLKYQGCNDQVCYPPSSIKTEAAITVGKAAPAPQKRAAGPHGKMAAAKMGGKTR